MALWEKFLAFLGLIEEDEDFEEEELHEKDWEERKKRVFQPAIGKPAVVLVRGQAALDRKEEMSEALKMGQMVILDLRSVELQSGQGVLDFICGTVYSTQGKVIRVAPGVFLAAPHGRLLETWDDEMPQGEEIAEDEPEVDEA